MVRFVLLPACKCQRQGRQDNLVLFLNSQHQSVFQTLEHSHRVVEVAKALWKLYSRYVNSFSMRIVFSVHCWNTELILVQVHSSSAMPYVISWYCVHLSGVLADFHSEHTPLFAPLLLLCEPWYRMCCPFLEPSSSFSLLLLSLHFCSGFVTHAKGQQFKGEMDKWASVWKYLSVFFLGYVAV